MPSDDLSHPVGSDPQLTSASDLQAALFDTMTDGVLIIDGEGVIADCNPALCHRLGYEKSELLGNSIRVFDLPEFAAKLADRMAEAMRQGEITFQSVYSCKDGSLMAAELNVRYLRTDQGTRFLGIVRDITQRKQLEASLQESNEIYQAAINTPALGFWATDMRGRFLDVNDAYVRQSGYDREALLSMGITDVDAMERPDETADHINLVIGQGYDRFRSVHRRADGSTWPVEVVTTYSPIRGGCLFVFIEDITDKVAQENRLELATRVFDTMDQAVVVSDEQNRIVSINPATTRITGYSLEEVVGKNPNIFSSGRHSPAFYADMWRSLNTTGQWEGEIWDRRKDGIVYAKWLTIKAVYDLHGQVYQYVSVFSDITERKKTEELIWKQANFDALTGLPNRHLLFEHLDTEIRKAHRSGSQIAVLFIDLDRFKAVNDSLGHAKGDALLVKSAVRIRDFVRDTDVIARLGGDEFTVILPDFGGRVNLERIVQGLIQNLAEPYDLGNGDQAYITASIGITLYPDDAENLYDLLKHSDQAMYVAKSEGRNRFSYFTPSMQEEARDKLALTNDLHHALANGQLEVYYQPIVDIRNGRINKAEALLRWNHPLRGMVSPMQFIPLAEDSGLIHEIGNWVFNQSLEFVKHLYQRFGQVIQISVNKSPIQLERPADPSWCSRISNLDLPGNCINVEITEGSLLTKSSRIKDRLLEFRNAGVEVSIDDFGTGFSALSYLHQFDIDYLKIDRSFVSDVTNRTANTALVEAIIVMAHKLGIKTIAEGVETESQRALLETFGCDYAQGYLFSRPVTATEFEHLIAETLKRHETSA